MKYLAAIALALGSPATAEVVHADAHDFEISQSVVVKLRAADALMAFTRVSDWWIADHTYSGNPANLTLEPKPGGCLCEHFPAGGGIEHLHVTYFEPGKYLILSGAMGPLLHEAVNGVLIVSVKVEGTGSRLTMNYRTSGYANGGGEKFAAMADKMFANTIEHYRVYANGVAGRP